MSPNVKIFILNWNGGDTLIRCLESVSNIEYDNFEIIVIDNASTDNSISNIHSKFLNIKIIALESNYGYSRGYNRAFELIGYSEDSFFMLLNNDTTVDKNILNSFLDAHKEIGSRECILGPKIYYMNTNLIWYAGAQVDLEAGIIKHIGIRQRDSQKGVSLEDTGYITGCCIFTHNSNIKRLNGFDEIFNMYCEDVDLSLRALKSKIRCIYVPEAILWHEVSSSFNSEFSINKMLLKLSSSWKLIDKHISSWKRFSGFFLLLFKNLISGLKLLLYSFYNRMN